jgi:hypothetical protein
MKKTILIIITILLSTISYAQIGIGTSNPDSSAKLHIVASGSAVGLLLPRITTNNRNANIKSPSPGLLIFNSSKKVLELSISGSLWADLINLTTQSAASGTTSSVGKVGIGTTSPDANSALEVASTTKGVVLPKAATDPVGVEGMIYYNTSSNTVRLFDGTTWISLIN